MPRHEMVGMGDCSCGWKPTLGDGVMRAFDKHLREMAEAEGTEPPPLICRTAECRVETFRPSRYVYAAGNSGVVSTICCPSCTREGQGW